MCVGKDELPVGGGIAGNVCSYEHYSITVGSQLSQHILRGVFVK